MWFVSALWFGACVVAVWQLYAPVEALIQREYAERFATLSPNSKNYVTKNLIKSAVLGASLPLSTYIVYKRVFWAQNTMPDLTRAVGSLYAANDVVALARVQLPSTTRAHHAVVLLLALPTSSSTMPTTPTRSRRSSSCAGSRWCPSQPICTSACARSTRTRPPRWRRSRLTYAPSFALNVTWQIATVRTTAAAAPAAAMAWMLMCGLIFFDDYVLMKHLFTTTAARRGG